MSELHRQEVAVHDQRAAESRSQTEEQHLSAFVAAQRLHGGVVHELDRDAEGLAVVELDPPASEVDRLGARPVVVHQAGVADRDDVVLPVFGELQDAFDHLARHQRWPRRKLPWFVAIGEKDLDTVAADVDDEYLHPTYNRPIRGETR